MALQSEMFVEYDDSYIFGQQKNKIIAGYVNVEADLCSGML